VKRHWFSRAHGATKSIVRPRAMSELAMFAAAMKAVFKWTTI
jgi:hypothetical protein